MNQKQRDYLVKRLQVLAEEKKAAFKVEEPNPEPFIKKLKVITSANLAKKFEFKVKNRSKDGRWEYQGRRSVWVDGKEVKGLDCASSESIRYDEYYTNWKEVEEEYKAFCKKHYETYHNRLKSIEDKCQEHCDKIVFADTYEEALKIIQEFSKF